jgi:hypothetical protein
LSDVLDTGLERLESDSGSEDEIIISSTLRAFLAFDIARFFLTLFLPFLGFAMGDGVFERDEEPESSLFPKELPPLGIAHESVPGLTHFCAGESLLMLASPSLARMWM